MSESTEIVPTEPKPQSQAEKQRQRTDALIKAVESRSKEFRTLLRESGIDFERFVEVFRRALIQSPDLLLADAGSVIKACMDACTDGLLPDGKHGAIVVYNVNVARKGDRKEYVKKAQWQPMFQGLLDVAYRSGNFKDIQARVVYEGDEFEYELGVDPWIRHKPARRPARSEGAPAVRVIAAYAVAKGVSGGVWVEVFEGEDIRKVNAVSRATSGPGKDWAEEMARKGPLRRLWKFLPKDSRMERIADHHDENFDLDQLEEPAAPERKLKAGFAPKGLTQSAQPTMDIVAGGREPEEAMHAQEDERQGRAEMAADEPLEDPERDWDWEAFAAKVAKAKTWKALKPILVDEVAAAGHRSAIYETVWERFQELIDAGADKTDFATDPVLFEAWLLGDTRDPETVEGNWNVLVRDQSFARLPDEEKARLLELVAVGDA